jgi:hypothetical protein
MKNRPFSHFIQTSTICAVLCHKCRSDLNDIKMTLNCALIYIFKTILMYYFKWFTFGLVKSLIWELVI